jgi:hypothetical protein
MAKKVEKNWDEIKYCSEGCRQSGKSQGRSESLEFQKLILDLLSQRGKGNSICPSEILPKAEQQNKEKMEAVRQAARLLAHQNKIEITQKGQVVDPNEFRGPIRLRSRQ